MNPPSILGSHLPTKLVTLSTGQPGLRAGLRVEIREPAETIRDNSCNSCSEVPANSPDSCLDFIASDETLDRYDEIISVSGWRLDSYRRNPVFQNAHQYGDVLFTLGRALITEVRSSGAMLRAPYLFQRIQFATDVNPVARIAYGLYKGKFLNAVSVGFIPLRWLDADAAEHSSSTLGSQPPATWRRKYLEQELLEVSAVGIPANPNALALAYKSGAIERADLKDSLDSLSRLLSRVNLQPATFNLQPWVSLARELRNLLRL